MNSSTHVYQVSDLASEMQHLLEKSYPEIWIEGELSTLSTPASGHLYFSLKDDQSQLRCAMFRNRARSSKYSPAVGDLVKIRAKISVYTARGDLQCIVQYMEPAGEGQLQRQFEELKNKLNNLGMFDVSAKQSLPTFAKQIGIVTSPSGAAIKDILSTLRRRCPGIPVTIYPAVVQGETAANSLINAINNAVQHQQCEVLILARGGGSLEDLWCFNNEELAHTIFNCPLPIVCGVGHEVDVTIADLVADYRAPTPTAAAEVLSPDTAQLMSGLNNIAYRLPNAFDRLVQKLSQNVDATFKQITHPKQKLAVNKERLMALGSSFKRTTDNLLSSRTTNMSQLTKSFVLQNPLKSIQSHTSNIQSLTNRLHLAQQKQIDKAQYKFESISSTLHAVSPLATLERGFSITRDQNDNIIRSYTDCDINDAIKVELKSGEISCLVTETKASETTTSKNKI